MTSPQRDPVAGRLGSAMHQIPEIRLAYLFGSRAHGRPRANSDFDIGVLLDEEATRADRDQTIRGLADRALATPDANRDTFTVLERAGELPADLAERLRGWAGFRNVLVHEYLEIDHAIAYRAIRDELGDLDALAVWAATKLDTGG